MFRLGLAAGLLALASVPAAADQVFECRDASGKVTFSQVPCDIASKPATPDARPQDYGTIYGEWRGQTQFKESAAGGSDRLAHVMTPLVLMIEEGGKVSGTTRDSGCRVAGLLRPGAAPTEPALDITVSSCSERAFNRRYTGSLVLYTRQQYATLRLKSLPGPRFGKSATYDVSATLRR